jgi:hypothetical protein
MLEEARLAYVRLREFDQHATPATVAAWLDNSRDAFPESKRDVVTWRYPHADDAWHTAFTTGMRVERVVVEGRAIVDRGTTVLVDEAEVRAKAAAAAARLHRRMEEM